MSSNSLKEYGVTKKAALLFIVIFMFCSSLMAIPLTGQLVPVKLPDGTSVSVHMFGSEYYVRMESTDGYTLIKGADGWLYYAKLNSDSTDFVSNGIKYSPNKNLQGRSGTANAPVAKEKHLQLNKKGINKKIQEGRKRLNPIEDQSFAPAPGASAKMAPSGPLAVSYNGSAHGITILVQFPEIPAVITQEEIEEFVNGRNYTGFGNNGSVRDYFYDVSNGKFDYTNEVTAYYTAQNEKQYYMDNGGWRLVVEAVEALIDSGYDFSNLTLDENGNIKALNVMYTGAAEYKTGLHPHQSGIGQLRVAEGIYASRYQISNIGNAPYIGVFTHENGHLLFGWPDLYDYGDESSGTGNYCLMSGGCWGGSGFNPMVPNPDYRDREGWENLIDITDAASGIQYFIDANSFTNYKYSHNEREYFIIDCRAQSGRNITIPDEGLLIWHVDRLGDNDDEEMTPTSHYLVSVEQADGLFDLEHGQGGGGDGDLFHGGYKTAFNDQTIPSALWWNETNSGLDISDISDAGTRMSFVVNHGITENLTVYLSVDNSPQSNTIQSEFRIQNNNPEEVQLGNCKLVYYTYDPSIDTSAMVWDLYWCTAGSGVKATFEKLDKTYESGDLKADTRITFSFPSTFVLNGNSAVTLQGALHDNSWSYNFDERDDWSHFVSTGNLAENVVILSSSGKVIFGNKPDAKPVYNLAIAPRPVVDIATVSFQISDNSMSGKNASIELARNGSDLDSWAVILEAGLNTKEVNLESFPAGVYQLELVIDEETVDMVTFDLTPPEGAFLAYTPESINFQNVAIGYTHDQTLKFANIGDGELVIDAITVENDAFGVDVNLPLTIPSGGSQNVIVKYTPDGSAENATGTLIVNSNAINSSVEIAVSGNGRYIYNLAVSPNPFMIGASITFDIQNSELNNTTANFTIAKVLANGGREFVAEFSETIQQGVNTITNPVLDQLAAGDYALIMRFAGWMVSADECTFTKKDLSYDYALSVSPAIFSSNASLNFTMDNPNFVRREIDFSLYQNFRNGAPRVLVSEFSHVASAGSNVFEKPEWDYLPRGYYSLEMSCIGTQLDQCVFEKLSNTNRFNLSVSPDPVVDSAKITFNVADQNLIGKTASLKCKQNGVVVFTTESIVSAGVNNVNLRFSSRFNPLDPGSYRMVLEIAGFEVDSTNFTKEDKSYEVTVSSQSVDFEGLAIGSSKTVTLVLTNVGNSNALISTITSSNSAFTHNATTPLSIAPGASKSVNVTFTPATAGLKNGTITIINVPDMSVQTIEVSCSGTGITQQTSDLEVTMNIDGNVVGNSIQPTMNIKNTGNQSIDLSDLTIEYYHYDSSKIVFQMACDIYYCSAGDSIVTKKFESLSGIMGNETFKANAVIKLGFSSGSLNAGQTLQINAGIHTSDWQYSFDESDDWSHVIGTDKKAANIVIRSKTTGQVLFGNEPVLLVANP